MNKFDSYLNIGKKNFLTYQCDGIFADQEIHLCNQIYFLQLV